MNESEITTALTNILGRLDGYDEELEQIDKRLKQGAKIDGLLGLGVGLTSFAAYMGFKVVKAHTEAINALGNIVGALQVNAGPPIQPMKASMYQQPPMQPTRENPPDASKGQHVAKPSYSPTTETPEWAREAMEAEMEGGISPADLLRGETAGG
jgi:hypothetical protein